MSNFMFSLPVGAIKDAIDNSANEYVKHVLEARKTQCLEAIGEILDDNGYLPTGTTWEVFGSRLTFSTYKPGSDEDLAHYFWEGRVYGPNRPEWDQYQMTTGKNGRPKYVRDELGRKVGIGEPSKYRTPAGMIKYPKDQYLEGQGVGSSMGVRHWTDAVSEGGDLWDQVIERCGEILRR